MFCIMFASKIICILCMHFRRLFSWLLGNEPQLLSAEDSLVKATAEDSSDCTNMNSYFHRHSKDLLVEVNIFIFIFYE